MEEMNILLCQVTGNGMRRIFKQFNPDQVLNQQIFKNFLTYFIRDLLFETFFNFKLINKLIYNVNNFKRLIVINISIFRD